MTGKIHLGGMIRNGGHRDPGEQDEQPGLWSGWRWPASLLAIAASLMHLPVMDEHLAGAPYMGALFVLFSFIVLGLAAALLLADTAIRYLLLGGWCLLAVLTYLATRSIAFPQLADDVGNWSDPWALAAAITAAGVVTSCLLAYASRCGPAVPVHAPARR